MHLGTDSPDVSGSARQTIKGYARFRAAIDRAPLSHFQQRFWTADPAISRSQGGVICHRVRLAGSLDIDALGRALQAVVHRQEALRTRFENNRGLGVQVVVPQVASAIRNIDMRHRLAALDTQIALDAQSAFDLSIAPLWRASVYRTGEDEHILVWCNHPIIMDGDSMPVILQDLWAAYDRAHSGANPEPTPLPICYTDFSLWQSDSLDANRVAESLRYWKQRLAGAASPIAPPHFVSRQTDNKRAAGRHLFEMPSAIADVVSQRAKELGVTAYAVWLAAYQAILFRYSDQVDLCIGAAVDNRPSGLLGDVAGCFANVLALRVQMTGDLTFRQLISRTQDVVSDALKHVDVPLEHVLGELGIEPEHGEGKLFRSLFSYDHDRGKGVVAGGLKWQIEPGQRPRGDSDFELRIGDSTDGVESEIRYSRELFEDSDARRFASHYLTLLQNGCDFPDTELSRLPLLSTDEYQQIVFDWNRTAAPYPDAAVIHERFEEWAQRSPNLVAIVAGRRAFTYGEIDERANRLAHYLIAQGVVRGAFVGICVKRSDEMIIAVLAVLKAGATYVPLDPAYPEERLEFMLQDIGAAHAAPTLVLTQSALLGRLPQASTGAGNSFPARFICLDNLGSSLSRQSCHAPERQTTAEDRAYVIFTSGSTGRPKGVVLRHKPVANVLAWVNESFGVSPADRLLFVTSLSFDLSVYDIFGALSAGASIRIASEEELRDPTALLGILKNEPITIWDSAPAALARLAPYFATPGAISGAANLRLVMLSGDWIPVALPDQIRGAFPGAQVVSLGGATEAAIWSNWFPIQSVDPAWPSIPYGKPISNARYHILDAHLQPVAVGVPGELHIGGGVLADGYLQREDLTRERFIDDPLAKNDAAPSGWPTGNKLYKTGDLARYFPDGNIEFLGRMDTQVKVRGFRVEAGEIESVLLRQDGVQDAIVKPHKDVNGQNYLVAYLVAKPNRQLVTVEITQLLHKRLPEYMVPAQMVVLDALPLTQNGKVDRAALAPPAAEAHRGAGRHPVAPSNDAERALLAIWEEVLGTSPIGVTDDFEDLGGHSLLAAVMMALVETRLGHRIPIEALIQKPTIQGLAEAITNQLELNGGVTVPLQTTGTRPPLFLIAGAGGHVFAFHAFARRLGAQFNVYGMRAIGIDGAEPPLESIPEIAARYLKEIKAIHPQGSYVLSGYSIGGIIAMELALQMQAAGMNVKQVIIFDMLAPGYPRKLPVWKRIYLHGRKLLELNGRAKSEYLRKRSENLRLRFLALFGYYTISDDEVPGIDLVPHERIRRVLSGLIKAWSNYWPQKVFDGQIVLIKSTEPIEWVGTITDDPLMGWQRWSTQPVQLYEVDAPHTEFFHGRYIDQVVRHVRAAMDSNADVRSDTASSDFCATGILARDRGSNTGKMPVARGLHLDHLQHQR